MTVLSGAMYESAMKKVLKCCYMYKILSISMSKACVLLLFCFLFLEWSLNS